MNPNDNKNTCDCVGCGGGCRCHLVAPIAVILIGIAFLLETFNVLSSNTVSIVWPILLIIAASTKMCGCCKK